MRRSRSSTGVKLAGLAIAAAACVVGFRAEATFSGQEALDGVGTVQVRLPRTPIRIVGSDVATDLTYEGIWHATGGTAKEAERNATTPSLVFSTDDRVGRLQADVPLRVHGLVDLELERLLLPATLDVEVETGRGDVEVIGVGGAVTVAIDVGDVTVEGGDAGVDVYTGRGEIDVTSTGFADLTTLGGDVSVTQVGAARDLFVETDGGGAKVSLASDANLDLYIEAREIRVRTALIRTTTEGQFSRRTGNATNRVEILAAGGIAEVVLTGS